MPESTLRDRLSSALSDRQIARLRFVVTATLLFSAVYYAVITIQWQLMVDSPVMHYVNFLIDHGLRPYQDITDNNMPGAYLTERWAMHVFGSGDLGWRLYEFFLLGVLTLAMIAIARPYDWLAGLYAASLFLLLHAADGPALAAEREEVMMTLLLISYAFLFASIRRRTPWLMLLFGLAAGLASSIKPTIGPLAIVLLIVAAVVLRRQRIPATRYVAYGSAGIVLVAGIMVHFLVHFGVLGQFLFVTRVITPSYVALWQPGVLELIRRSWPVTFFPLLVLGLAALALNRRWNWEQGALLLGLLFGLFSYFAQAKGSLYHRYPYLAFFLLLLGIEFTTALRKPGWPRVVGVAGLLTAILLNVPYDLLKTRTLVGNSILTEQLERDLQTLGGPEQLQHQVQCFDLIFGCLNALDHDGLVQNTGFTGDLLFFTGTGSRASNYYRDLFSSLQAKHPAQVFVIGNEWFGHTSSYRKLEAWPEFLAYLNANYTEIVSRTFPLEGRRAPLPPTDPNIQAYRIYIRNGSPLLARAHALQ